MQILRRGFGTPLYVVAHLVQPLLEARGCIQLLRIVSIGIVIWYERLIFTLSSLECSAALHSSEKSVVVGSDKKSSSSSASSSSVPSSKSTTSSSLQVTILSDPQLIDSHTYAWVDELIRPISTVIQYILRWASDTYVRKSFTAVVRKSGKMKSDGVIWLGDLLDGGRRPFLNNEDVAMFEKQVSRFKGLFQEDVPTIYLPGNHDVRIPTTHNPNFEQEYKDSRQRWLEKWAIYEDVSASSSSSSSSPPSSSLVEGVVSSLKTHRSTWSKNGGKERLILYPPGGPSQINVLSSHWKHIINARFPLYLNQTSPYPTHEIILVDSLDLAGMQPAASVVASKSPGPDTSWRGEARARFGETYNFVESFVRDRFVDDRAPTPPQRILISHIPLYRPVNSNCNLQQSHHGVTRESHGVIDQGVDQYATYQNLLSSSVTSWLLESIEPAFVFSGDNHDHCEVQHRYGGSSTSASASADGTEQTKTATELTLKAFSMTEGVRLPGYARLLLQYDSHTDQAHSAYVPCLLPDQISIWTQSYPFHLLLLFLVFMIDRRWRIGNRLDQQARLWMIIWQDWVGISSFSLLSSSSEQDHDEEEWQLVEEGGANSRRHSSHGQGRGRAGPGEGGDYDDDDEKESDDDDDDEGLDGGDEDKNRRKSLATSPGTKRIRFGGNAHRSLLSPSKKSKGGRNALPFSPISLSSSSPSSSSSSPYPSISPFQARAWRELRRAAKANEKVILRDGPLREFTKVLLWPFALWVWLQLF